MCPFCVYKFEGARPRITVLDEGLLLMYIYVYLLGLSITERCMTRGTELGRHCAAPLLFISRAAEAHCRLMDMSCTRIWVLYYMLGQTLEFSSFVYVYNARPKSRDPFVRSFFSISFLICGFFSFRGIHRQIAIASRVRIYTYATTLRFARVRNEFFVICYASNIV